VLAHLTRKSLVVAEETTGGGERYWMLETVRDYARQKLASRGATEIRALRGRHAEFFGSWVDHQLPDPQPQGSAMTVAFSLDALRRVDAEYDNVRTVLAWWLESEHPALGIRLATGLNGFWLLQRGLYAEARRWLGALLELDERTARDS